MSGPDPAPQPPGEEPPKPLVPAFEPVPVRRRRTGWTAEKQRRFIATLAECGVARRAAAAAGMSERSAHRLALRPDAESFATAWDAALAIAARRGCSTLFEYAFEGTTETVWRDGKIVYQRRRPSEKALFFLLTRLDPVRFGRPREPDPINPDFDPIQANLNDLELHLDALGDLPEDPDEPEDEGDLEDLEDPEDVEDVEDPAGPEDEQPPAGPPAGTGAGSSRGSRA
jgi:hypothetical protein